MLAALELLVRLNIAQRERYQDWRNGVMRTRWVLRADADAALNAALSHGIDVNSPLPGVLGEP